MVFNTWASDAALYSMLSRSVAKPFDPPLVAVPRRAHLIAAFVQEQCIQRRAICIEHPAIWADACLAVFFESFQQGRNRFLVDGHGVERRGEAARLERVPEHLRSMLATE